MASTCCTTSGSVTFVPPLVPMTICSVSPDSCGAAACSSSRAWVDSVLGSVKLFEYPVPTARVIPKEITKAASQAPTTIRRWWNDQLASLRIRPLPPPRPGRDVVHVPSDARLRAYGMPTVAEPALGGSGVRRPRYGLA